MKTRLDTSIETAVGFRPKNAQKPHTNVTLHTITLLKHKHVSII